MSPCSLNTARVYKSGYIHMNRQFQLLLAFVIVFTIAGQLRAKDRFDFSTDIGVAALQEDGSVCLSIKKANIPPGATVVIVSPFVLKGDPENTIMIGKVISRAHGPCNIPEAAERGDSSYTVEVAKGNMINDQPYFAILASPRSLSIKDGEVTGDLDGDGVLEHFRECTSSEGVHLTIWTGTPLKGVRRWHRYFYIGYDVEPTCTEADYSGN